MVTEDSSPIEALAEQLISLPDAADRCSLLNERVPALAPPEQDALADALKGQADRLMHSDIERCRQAAGLLYVMAEMTQKPVYRGSVAV